MLPTACALECIHTYSLIHDDLPAMDNDDLRRGRPTNHKIYGEAAAILAGDSLLTYAFEILTGSRNKLSPEKKMVISNLIARASGPEGMAGGQSLDIANENQAYPFELLQTIHRSKTGALIKCSVEVGAIGADAAREQLDHLREYGVQIGLAFQIIDDLLDVTSTTDTLGKNRRQRRGKGKSDLSLLFRHRKNQTDSSGNGGSRKIIISFLRLPGGPAPKTCRLHRLTNALTLVSLLDTAGKPAFF